MSYYSPVKTNISVSLEDSISTSTPPPQTNSAFPSFPPKCNVASKTEAPEPVWTLIRTEKTLTPSRMRHDSLNALPLTCI